MKDNIYIGLRKRSSTHGLKRPSDLPDIEEYVYMVLDEGTARLLNGIEKVSGMTESEIWKAAEENTKKEAVITPLGKLIAEAEGIEYDEAHDSLKHVEVLTNTRKVYGASAMISKELLKEFAERHNVKNVIIIPSSVHEVLVMPEGEIELSNISRLVAGINQRLVSESDRLADKAYMIAV